MHDTARLEQRGVPTAVVVTAAFVGEAETQRAALGADDLEPVVITHPLSTLSEDEIEDRAREAAGQIDRVLTRPAGPDEGAPPPAREAGLLGVDAVGAGGPDEGALPGAQEGVLPRSRHAARGSDEGAPPGAQEGPS